MVNFDENMEEYMDDLDDLDEEKEEITQQSEPKPEQDIKVPDELVKEAPSTPVVEADTDREYSERVAKENNLKMNNDGKTFSKFSQMLEPSVKDKDDNRIDELEDQIITLKKEINKKNEESFKEVNSSIEEIEKKIKGSEEEHVISNEEINKKINILLEDNKALKKRVAEALELINADQIKYTDDKTKRLENEFKELKNSIVDKDNKIEALTETTIEMILIEMETLSDSLNDADRLLDDIGNRKQFDDITKNEKNIGLNTAYKVSMSYLEDAATNAKQIKPVLREIKMNLKTINEKLKHASER